MIAKPRRFCVRSTRMGLTLIEVIAATLLLGTLLVSILLAYSRHAIQIKKAQQRLAVINALDDKVEDWYLTRRGVPVNESGPLIANGTTQVQWRTRTIANESLRRVLLSEKIRVEARTADGEVVSFIDILQAAAR